MTEKQLEKLKIAFRAGCDDVQACVFAGIPGKELVEYEREHPAFAAERVEMNILPIALAKIAVFKKVQRASVDDTPNAKDDADTARWLLERRAKKEYSNRTELTGEEGGAIKVECLIMDI